MNEPYSINDIKIFNKENNNDIIKMDMDIYDKIINYIKFIKDNNNEQDAGYKRPFLSLMHSSEYKKNVLDEIFIAITFMYIYQYIDNEITSTTHHEQFTIQRNIFDRNFREYCNEESTTKTRQPPYIKNILKSARDVLYEEVNK